MLGRLLRGLPIVVLLLAVVLVANALLQGSRQLEVQALPRLAVDRERAATSLAGAVRARTITGLVDPAASAAEFDKLHAHLAERYPLVHRHLEREVVGGQSLLYTWRGSDAGAAPVAWLAHLDVVPIAPGTESLWKQPPFDGVIDGEVVWGRGAWDNKGNLIAQLEALEIALAAGVRPRRTLYLSYGADEEVGGRQGAMKIAALLAERKVRLAYVIDEGLVVTEGILPGVAAPIALIGVAEKGYLSLRLVAESAPGHSSMPPAPGESAVGMLARALARLDAQRLPGGIRGVAHRMFDVLAPELPFVQRVAMSNLWLTRPLVERQLERGASTNALIRTSTAMTIGNVGHQANGLPGRAEAVINFRLVPGDTAESVLAQVRETVADPRLRIDPVGESSPASRVSSSDGAAYRQIEQAVREVFPGALVAPGLMLGATDARHFEGVADAVYRFTPIRADAERLKLFHGTDERIRIDHLADMVRFYHRLLTLSVQ